MMKVLGKTTKYLLPNIRSFDHPPAKKPRTVQPTPVVHITMNTTLVQAVVNTGPCVMTCGPIAQSPLALQGSEHHAGVNNITSTPAQTHDQCWYNIGWPWGPHGPCDSALQRSMEGEIPAGSPSAEGSMCIGSVLCLTLHQEKPPTLISDNFAN